MHKEHNMPSKQVNNTKKPNVRVPNARERLAAQYGQINDLVTADWDTSTPTTIALAINRLAAAFVDLLAKLDADAGVTDVDYESTLKP